MSSLTSLILLLVLLVSCTTVCKAERHVEIVNKLETGSDLLLHCKSKDDDLGEHVLSINKSFTFQFKENFFGGTLFFCGVTFNGTLHWFDAFVDGRDSCHICQWKVKGKGPCLQKERNDPDPGPYESCFFWNE